MNPITSIPSTGAPPSPAGSEVPELQRLFTELTLVYQDLQQPPPDRLHLLDEELIAAQKQKDTSAYILAAIASVFFLVSFPILITWGYQLATSMEVAALPYFDQTELFEKVPGVAVGLVFGAAAAVTYAFVLPLHSTLKLFRRYDSSLTPKLKEIATSDWRFRFYQAVMLYFAVAVGILLLHTSAAETRAYTAVAARIWFFLPALPLSILPSIVLIALLVLIFPARHTSETRTYASLLREVLLLLLILKDTAAPGELLLSQRLAALDRIARISSSLRDLYSEDDAHIRVALWAQRRMHRIADNFAALSAWIAFPKADTITQIKRRLVFYANVVSTGELDDLPSSPVDESFPFDSRSPKRGYLRRLGALMWLLLLVTSPILVYAVVAMVWGVAIPSTLQTPAAIAYSAWIAACLLAHIEDLAPEAKTALLDVVRLIFHR